MVSNTELNDNYKAISQIPIVKQTLKCVSRLTKENKALVKENAMLKKIIDTLFDRQSVSTKTCCCGCSNSNRPIPDIQIKKEKIVVDMSQNTSPQVDENIVYELSEDADNKHIPYIIEEVEESAEEEEVEEEEELRQGWEEERQEEERLIQGFPEERREELRQGWEEERREELRQAQEEEEEEEVEVEESAEEEEEEVEVEESAEEEEEEVEVEESEEEEEEVYEITIKNKSYYTSNETDGPIYAITDDEDIGDQIGEFKTGKPTFYKKTKK